MKADKVWTWLILGFIGFFVILPVGASFVAAWFDSLDVNWNKILLLGGAAVALFVVIWIFVSASGGGSGHGSGQRALAQAQRDLASAVQQVRTSHMQRMYAEQQDQPRRYAAARNSLLETRARVNGQWLSHAEAREDGLDV